MVKIIKQDKKPEPPFIVILPSAQKHRLIRAKAFLASRGINPPYEPKLPEARTP